MKVQRQSLATQVAGVILERTGSGHWSVGTKLPGEAALAAEMGVGRSTVREAIRDLVGRGLLDSRQGAGVFVVASRPIGDWPEVLRRAAINEVVEGRLAIESEAAYRAALRRTDADLDALDETLSGRAEAARHGDDHAYVDADLAFHEAVVTAAHNQVLTELFAGFRTRVRTAMIDALVLFGPDDPRPRQVDDEHAGIVAAIRDGDSPLAVARTRTHLEELHRRIGSPQESRHESR